MRVVVQVGLRAGEVVDLPPRDARAMLDDGRAIPVPPDGDDGALASPPVRQDTRAAFTTRDPVAKPKAGGRGLLRSRRG